MLASLIDLNAASALYGFRLRPITRLVNYSYRGSSLYEIPNYSQCFLIYENKLNFVRLFEIVVFYFETRMMEYLIFVLFSFLILVFLLEISCLKIIYINNRKFKLLSKLDLKREFLRINLILFLSCFVRKLARTSSKPIFLFSFFSAKAAWCTWARR